MHHAGAQDFQPAGVLAQGAAVAVADDAIHVDLDARLGEGEMAATEADLALGAVHAAGEVDQHAFQVGHGDVLADRQPLHLVEHDLRAGGDGLVAVAHARQNHPDGVGMKRLHGANLTRRGMGAQHHALVDVEGVPHVAGRMVGRHVEQLEVVVVALHLAAVEHLETHVGEDGGNLAQRLGAGVQAAQAHRVAGEGHVDLLLRQGLGQLGQLDRPDLRLESGLQSDFDLVGYLPDLRPLFRRQRTDAPHHLRQRPLAAQVVHPPAVERGQIVHLRQALQRLRVHLAQLVDQGVPFAHWHADLRL